MISPTSEPLAIRMTSGLPFGASARTYAPLAQAICRGTLSAIERRHVLTRQNQRNRMVSALPARRAKRRPFHWHRPDG